MPTNSTPGQCLRSIRLSAESSYRPISGKREASVGKGNSEGAVLCQGRRQDCVPCQAFALVEHLTAYLLPKQSSNLLKKKQQSLPICNPHPRKRHRPRRPPPRQLLAVHARGRKATKPRNLG
jgi:hypothetical protein